MRSQISDRSAAAVRRRWQVAWLGGAGIGFVNGAVREAVFRDLGEKEAHQISVGTLVAALTGYMWFLDRRWPIPDTRTALQIGSSWALATIVFEFGLGRFGPAPKPWAELLKDYDITEGRLWPIVLAHELFAPAAIRFVRRRPSA